MTNFEFFRRISSDLNFDIDMKKTFWFTRKKMCPTCTESFTFRTYKTCAYRTIDAQYVLQTGVMILRIAFRMSKLFCASLFWSIVCVNKNTLRLLYMHSKPKLTCRLTNIVYVISDWSEASSPLHSYTTRPSSFALFAPPVGE